MADQLKKIQAPVSSELKEFEKRFKDLMRSKTALLDRIMHYIVKRKGKRIRPLLVMLSARLVGDINDSTYRAAALVELLHTATLVHDDVVDDAMQRRGVLSINALWKNKIAVLVGDYLLSRGLLLSTSHKEYQLLQIVAGAVQEMSEGELLQIEKARKLNVDEEIYYDIIRQKTASLLATACEAGASSATDDEARIARVRELGLLMGMAFQIKDDLFDYGDKQIGKPRGIDIKEQKMTLPLIYVLNHADRSKRKWMINVVKRHHNDKRKVKELIQHVKDAGGIAYAEKRMADFRQQALDVLQEFEPSPIRKSIEDLLWFTTDREL